MNKVVLITGVAGFIGCQLTKKYLDKKWKVIGIDKINNYYSVKIKKDRLALLTHPQFTFYKLDIVKAQQIQSVFSKHKPDLVIHLAAEAGVRYSIENPNAFVDSNLISFMNIIECCRRYPPNHFLYASSSSVYGLNESLPLKENHLSDHPTSLYAASKKANEMIAHSYASTLGIKSTGMRFFSVYGPWGRPDMAVWLFADKIAKGVPIELFNRGKHTRDLIFIDDLVETIYRIGKKPPKANFLFKGTKPVSSISSAPYRVVNIGSGKSIDLFTMVKYIEQSLGMKATIRLKPKQKADSLDTKANCSMMVELTKYTPSVDAREGIRRFIDWFKEYRS